MLVLMPLAHVSIQGGESATTTTIGRIIRFGWQRKQISHADLFLTHQPAQRSCLKETVGNKNASDVTYQLGGGRS